MEGKLLSSLFLLWVGEGQWIHMTQKHKDRHKGRDQPAHSDQGLHCPVTKLLDRLMSHMKCQVLFSLKNTKKKIK